VSEHRERTSKREREVEGVLKLRVNSRKHGERVLLLLLGWVWLLGPLVRLSWRSLGFG
jgi:hypothetical protein